jgi:hypothetical protein
MITNELTLLTNIDNKLSQIVDKLNNTTITETNPEIETEESEVNSNSRLLLEVIV